jgi:hypothetical protein
MNKLFENWNKYLNESIGAETLEELERVLSAAYDEGIRSHDSTQRDAATGEPVNSDAHTEVVSQLLKLVQGHLENLNDDDLGEPDHADQDYTDQRWADQHGDPWDDEA